MLCISQTASGHCSTGPLIGRQTLKALRDHLEDLGTLIAAIMPRVAPEPERITLDRSAARALFRYAWPLRIRVFVQALHAAVALTDTLARAIHACAE